MGVIAPIQSYPGITAALIKVSMYNEPLNKIIPTINNAPAHFNNAWLNSLYKMPQANNANTW